MKSVIVLLSLLSISSSFACAISQEEMEIREARIKLNERFKFWAPTVSPNLGDVSRSDWDGMIKAADEFYTPVFKNLGQVFVIGKDWNNNEVNAFASASGKKSSVMFYGGYARAKGMTKDGYLSIICHEIGHHLGGFPKDAKGGGWASVEGAADYFSTLKCMKELLKNDPKNEEIARKLDLPTEVKANCRKEFPVKVDYYICLRASKASEDYGNMLAEDRGGAPVSLVSPDPGRVSITEIGHPGTQCRTDTKYAGALCNVSTAIAVGINDETVGTCYKRNTLGIRPSCWFKAKN